MCITQNHQIKIGLGSEGEERLMSLLWSPGAPRLWISNNFIDTVSTIESDIKVESNVTWSSWGFLNVHSESIKQIKGKHSKHSEVQDPLNSGEQSMQFILPLIEILKFDWLRQILYAAILCFLTNLIFLIYPLHVTYWPHITFLNPFHVTLRWILHYDVTQL